MSRYPLIVSLAPTIENQPSASDTFNLCGRWG